MLGYALAKHLAKGGKEIERGSGALDGAGLFDDGVGHLGLLFVYVRCLGRKEV